MSLATEVQVENRRLKLSNLDKVLYPAVGFTKAQVIDYYMRIAPAILPHLHNRPLTLKRYPDGVEAEFFYEKSCPSHRPPWVKTTAVWSGSSEREIKFCLANDLPTLAWLANLASLELHTSLATTKIERPTMVVFDLDPGPPADIVLCSKVALWLREIFDQLKLQSVAKTSGGKGLQVYVPLNTPTDYDVTKTFAQQLALHLEHEHPREVVSRMNKDLRTGKVFIDWSQNDEHKTTVCVYSLRAREHPTVSTPVTWDEIEAAASLPGRLHVVGSRKSTPRPAQLQPALRFEAGQVIERYERLGDLFEPAVTLKQKLPGA